MNNFDLDVHLGDDVLINNDYKTMFLNIAEEYKNLVPTGVPLGYKKIEIKFDVSGPMCVINYLPNHYLIFLNLDVASRYYDQACYQFAHELTHIYCCPNKNSRFVEGICMMASLYFLDYLSVRWLEHPPYSNWKEYAVNFSEYKDGVIRGINMDLGEYSDLSNIFFEAEDYANQNERNLQKIFAKKVLPIFQEDKTIWKILPEFAKLSDFSNNGKINFNEFLGSIYDPNTKDGLRKILTNINDA